MLGMERKHLYNQRRKSKLISTSGTILFLFTLLNQAHSMSWPQVASKSSLPPSTPRSSLTSTALHPKPSSPSPPPSPSSDKGERVFLPWKRRQGKIVLHLNLKNMSRNALQTIFQQWFKQEQQQRFSNIRKFLQSRPSSSPQHTSVSSPGKMIWLRFNAFFGASPTNSSPPPSSSPWSSQTAMEASRDQRRDCVTSTTQTTGFKLQSEPVSRFQKTPQIGNRSLETLNAFLTDQCQSNILSTIKGTYHWPLVQNTATIRQLCSYNPPREAIRKCLSRENILVWLVPDLSMCAPPLQTVLATIIRLDNYAEISWYLEELTRCWDDQVPQRAPYQVLEKLREVLMVGIHKGVTDGAGKMLDKNIAQSIIMSLSNILGRLGRWKSNSLLYFVEEFSQNVEVAKGNDESGNDTEDTKDEFRSLTLSAEYLAIAAVELEETSVAEHGLTFTVSSENGTIKVSVGSDHPISDDDLLSIPSVLLQSHPRVQFSYYRDTSLFLVKDAEKKLNSYVIAASLNNRSVSNLLEPISITLNHLWPLMPNETAVCAFWKFNASINNPGCWATQGCWINGTLSTSVQSVCHCDHLTHFGVLVDNGSPALSPMNSLTLSILSYMGSSVSIICLFLTILTYLLFHQLRTDFPSRLLLHLAAALFCLHVCFLIDSSLSYSISTLGGQSAHVLCTAVGVLLHYSLLSSVSWMGLEALHLHLALVRVFFYTPHRLMKTAALGWGLPVVVVGLLLIIDADAYQAVDEGHGEVFCWIRPGLPLGLTVIAYLAVVLLMNLLVFIFVLMQLAHLRSGRSFPNSGPAPATGRHSPSGLQAAGSLASLLGLTWILGLVAFGPTYLPFMYLFVISNSLQGFCIFLFHCILRPKVRRLWLKQLNSIQLHWLCKFGREKRSWFNFQRAPRPLCSNTSPDPAACLEVKVKASTIAPNG